MQFLKCFDFVQREFSRLSIVPLAAILPMSLPVPCTSMCRTRSINWLCNAGSPARSFRVCICTPLAPSDRAIQQGQLLTRRNVEAIPTVVDASLLEVSEGELKAAILSFYSLLDEQQRRLYAGLESLKLGRGGDRSLADFLELDPHTVARGRQQLLTQGVEVSKKRELIGNFNSGVKWDRSSVRVNHHDFRSDASGVGISYGIYDTPNNRGTVCVGISHDTPAFAAHSIATWWKREGSRRHGRAPKLLVLADSGGSNGCSSWAWKTEIQVQLCNPFGITAAIAHYPTCASKWNPIEHRLFSEISKHWAAEPLVSYDKMLGFIRNTSTKTGLVVTAYLDRTEYPTGLKPAPTLISSLALKPAKLLPRWNYTIAPNL